MIQRSHFQLIIDRISEPRRFINVLFGPRQVGKTTTIIQITEVIKMPYYFVTADAVLATNKDWLEQNWEIARIKFKQSGATEFLLVIDEIQKIGNWSETVKMLWDNDTKEKLNIKVILLGSSRLLLQQGLTESLAGRFEVIYMGHWSFTEMHEAFDWNADQYAWFGGYPGAAPLIKDEQRWKDYVCNSLIEASISKDILMLTRIDKPALMKRLFVLGCSYSGQLLSFNKIIGQLQDAGNTTTLAHYLYLLDSAGLLRGIGKYSIAEVKKRSSVPKFMVYNTALMSAQKDESFTEIHSKPAAWGRIVESCIGAHLINHSFTGGYNVYYWRDGNEEVDFVLEKKGKVIAIEVHSGAKTATAGITVFKKQFTPYKILIVGTGGLPWEEFIKINPKTLFE